MGLYLKNPQARACYGKGRAPDGKAGFQPKDPCR